jgi:hypothetical protein
MSTDESDNIEGIYMLTALFLERSAQSLITVILTGNYIPQNFPLLQLLITSCERWDDLSIYADAVVIRGLSPIRGRLHQLDRLELVRSDGEVDTQPGVLDMFSYAPCLSEVAFRFDRAFTFLIPGSQLTEFTTSYAEVTPILYVLRELVNLEALTLDREGEEGPMDQLFTVDLPQLCELTITTDLEGHPGKLLDYLKLPALLDLNLDCEDSAICPYLIQLITRSACRLDSFTLSYWDDLDTPLAGVLALMPHLTELELKGTGTTSAFLTQLTRVPPALAPAIVPRLEALTLRAPFSQALLMQLVESRFASEPDPIESEPDPNVPELVCTLEYLGLGLTTERIESVLAYGLPPLCDMGLEVALLR